MKPKLLVLFLSLFVLSILFSAYAFWQDNSVAKITFPLGNVMVLAKGEKKMQKAGFNHLLYPGDKVQTEKQARCEIKYNDGSIVRIDQQSIYTINKVEVESDKKEVESSLSLGKLWANIKKLASASDKWFVRSPSAVVAVRGTIYRMETLEDSSSTIAVYEGSVNVGPPTWAPASGTQGQNQGGPPQRVQGPTQIKGPSQVTLKEWLEIVKAQQQIIVKPDGSFQKSDFDLVADAQSSWVKWNQERDKLINR